jgi:hypothetical protein
MLLYEIQVIVVAIAPGAISPQEGITMNSHATMTLS